jgi:uncharacterized protein YeeX (DUF496 family)
LQRLLQLAGGKEIAEYNLRTAHILATYEEEIEKYLAEHDDTGETVNAGNPPEVDDMDALFAEMDLANRDQPVEDRHVESFFDRSAQMGKIENMPKPLLASVDGFMAAVNPEYRGHECFNQSDCPRCNSALYYDDDAMIMYCSRQSCTYFVNIELDIGPPTYKELQEHPKETQYIYSRITRLKYWLRVIRGTEPSKKITDNEWAKINQVCDNLMYSKSEMSYEDMRTILGNLRLPHLYDYIPYILKTVCKIQPVHITSRMEEFIKTDFREVCPVFDSLNLPDRSSFISYPYFIIKSLQRRGYYDVVNRLKALKTVSCINNHDKIWRMICEKLNWEYITTDL